MNKIKLVLALIMVTGMTIDAVRDANQKRHSRANEYAHELMDEYDSIFSVQMMNDFKEFIKLNDQHLTDSIKYKIESSNQRHLVTATIYHPVEGQCDSTPLITADCSKIDLDKLEKGELRWIAISRELREHYKYGEKVRLTCIDDPTINGIYEVHDTMNPRYKRYIDILTSPNQRTLGKWENVLIEKI